jgi:hypothetical protein
VSRAGVRAEEPASATEQVAAAKVVRGTIIKATEKTAYLVPPLRFTVSEKYAQVARD